MSGEGCSSGRRRQSRDLKSRQGGQWRGGECDEDESRCGALSEFCSDETAFKYPTKRSNFGGGISVDVDIVKSLVVVEEELPNQAKWRPKFVRNKKAILGLDLVVPRWDTTKPPGRMEASAAQRKRARSSKSNGWWWCSG
ncbi:Hypothetical predicted protein [Olea europaea subsp. europaea]|uniref:Uncharacterized protein n=1 Tax=Olea europaea subsp. europaea TaxID=158383 RepID=A0A8S0R6K9_OLEEU|nr:Hypothetical predicted protein [Olea europaea subsp. europaea]